MTVQVIPGVSASMFNRAVSRMVEVIDMERNNRWQDGGYDIAVERLMTDITQMVGDNDKVGDAPFGLVAMFNTLRDRAIEVLGTRSKFAAEALAKRGWTRHGEDTLFTEEGDVFNYRNAPIEVLNLITEGWAARG